MKVISNAGPLITLSKLGKLCLLKELYGTIVIPEAVRNEVIIHGQGAVGAEEVALASWITVQTVINRLAVETTFDAKNRSFQMELNPTRFETTSLTRYPPEDTRTLFSPLRNQPRAKCDPSIY